MPGTIELDLDGPDPAEAYPARLHGAACALLELPATDHRAQQQPFTVRPLVVGRSGAHWRLGWLPDGRPPLRNTETVRFGPIFRRVRRSAVATSSFAQLAGSGCACTVDLRMVSPTYFSRNGRDHLLPDPVLIIDSAVRRWNQYAPPDFQVSESEHRALRSRIVLTDFVGRTERGPVTFTTQQTGFVGTVRLALPRSAERGSRYLLAALMRFLGVAGVGAQTTHGFGAVELVALDGRLMTAPVQPGSVPLESGPVLATGSVLVNDPSGST